MGLWQTILFGILSVALEGLSIYLIYSLDIYDWNFWGSFSLIDAIIRAFFAVLFIITTSLSVGGNIQNITCMSTTDYILMTSTIISGLISNTGMGVDQYLNASGDMMFLGQAMGVFMVIFGIVKVGMFLAEGLFAINTLGSQVGVPQYMLPYGYGVPQYPSTYVQNTPVMKEEGVKGIQYVMIPYAK